MSTDCKFKLPFEAIDTICMWTEQYRRKIKQIAVDIIVSLVQSGSCEVEPEIAKYVCGITLTRHEALMVLLCSEPEYVSDSVFNNAKNAIAKDIRDALASRLFHLTTKC